MEKGMSERSAFILGKYVFIKVISLDPVVGELTNKSLADGSVLPFESNEFLFSHIINKDLILNEVPKENNSLLTPKTKVLISDIEYSVSNFERFKDMPYQNTLEELSKDFISFDKYPGGSIRTALIISKTVDGNYLDFLKKYNKSAEYNKLVIDSLIHIAYLFHVFQNRYQAVHGDPKVQNFTWLILPNSININYDFRDEFGNGKIITRKNVKHLFYLTDLEFVWSPIVKYDNKLVYNFHHNYFWYGNSNIYVPKISEQEYYQLNFNLYGGYDRPGKERMEESNVGNLNIYELYGPKFPRMFTIDILTLVKMFLTYWFGQSLSGDVLRKLNIYFAKFVALSAIEENPNRRNTGNYLELSPASFATLIAMRP